jgi:thioredoxin-related protein
MDTVTYPDKKVSKFIAENMIAVRILHDQQPYAANFKIRWTPTLVVLDWEGNEVFRSVGYLPPEDMVPALMIGVGKVHFVRSQYREAISVFSDLLDKYPKSDQAPEALFFLGVARFKDTNDPKDLQKAYEELSRRYPDSEWTKKARPYKLLPQERGTRDL